MNDFKCKICNERFKDPVSLACGETFCKEHIERLLSGHFKDSFNCPSCKLEMPTQKFQVNEFVSNMIKRGIDQIQIKPEYTNIFKSFQEKFDKIKSNYADPEVKIDQKLSEITENINSDIKKVKNHLDELAQELNNKINDYYIEFRNAAHQTDIVNHNNNILKNMEFQLNEYKQCLESFIASDDDRKTKKIEIEELIKCVDKEMMDHEKKIFNYKSLVYEPAEIENNSIKFGFLNVS